MLNHVQRLGIKGQLDKYQTALNKRCESPASCPSVMVPSAQRRAGIVPLFSRRQAAVPSNGSEAAMRDQDDCICRIQACGLLPLPSALPYGEVEDLNTSKCMNKNSLQVGV